MRRNKFKYGFTVFAFCLPLLAGCGSNGNANNFAANSMNEMTGHSMTMEAADTQTITASSSTEASAADPQKQYKLEAALEKDGDQYSINVNSDITFSEEHYGGSHVYGEGHIHFYLNGGLMGPIMNNGPFLIEDYLLKDGDNAIKLTLAGNNHSEPYNATVELKLTKK
jgi:hypothetical protein